MEFLTNVSINVPEGTLDATVEKSKKAEAAPAAELAAQGNLFRLWRPPLRPGEWRTLGLFRADSEQQLKDIIATSPLHIWMTVEVTPLRTHPSDPATQQTTEPTPNSATTCSHSGMHWISATT
jgi:muconolactone D-isomerase